MNEGLSHIYSNLPTVELIVLFQHPNPSEKRIVCNVLIKGIMECLEMCFMEIVASVHFVYDWHPNKNGPHFYNHTIIPLSHYDVVMA